MSISDTYKNLTNSVAILTARLLGTEDIVLGTEQHLSMAGPKKKNASKTHSRPDGWLSAPAYQFAVARCRLRRKFFFLGLPQSVREQIYAELWLGNNVHVCGWLKSHEDDFAAEERSQLLLTCDTIYKEARKFYYFYSRWKFVSTSSLNYFTWPAESAYPHCSHVAKVTITNVDILYEFSRLLRKFNNLQLLTLDVASDFRVRTQRRARDVTERKQFVRSLLSVQYYTRCFQRYLYVQRNWTVHIIIHVTYSTGQHEVVLVDIDRADMIFNYCRPPVQEKLYIPHIPSSDDDDAEYTIISEL